MTEAIFFASTLVFFADLIQAVEVKCQLGNSIWEETCDESGAQNAYCCKDDMGGCCYTLVWWAEWYVWFGVILGVSIFVLCCLICVRHMSKTPNRRTATAARPSPRSEMELPEVTYHADALPTYEDVEAQGIPEEYLQYAEKGESNPGFEVSVEGE